MASKHAHIQTLAQRFRILGDPSRLRIVISLLDAKSLNVSQICRKLRISQPTVSRHLSILKMCRVAEATRMGKEIFYSIPAARKRALKMMIDRAGSLGT